MSHKDLWIEENQRLTEEAEERLGRTLNSKEQDYIDDRTAASLNDKLADAADALRKKDREG
jgi:hypothetical protein